MDEGKPASVLLPDDIIDLIAERCCRGDIKAWAGCWRWVCRKYYDISWLQEKVGVPYTDVVIVSPHATGLANGGGETITTTTISAGLSKCKAGGAVLVYPGQYNESIRITQDVAVIGIGNRRRVVVEGPGWEPALVFAGLGTKKETALGVRGGETGDTACVENMTLRCRNQQQSFVAYISRGQPRLFNLNIDGGVWVSGRTTRPKIHGCEVSLSRNCGVRLTDHAKGLISHSRVELNRAQGILIERQSAPVIKNTTVKRNRLQNILITEGCRPTLKANHIDRIKVEISAQLLDTNTQNSQVGPVDGVVPSPSYGELVYYKSNYRDRHGDTSNLVVVTISPHWIEPTIDDEEFRLHGESDIEIDSDDYYESD